MIDPTLQTVMLGTALIGAVAGFVGSFAVIRRRSLQGDAISHAALPGVALAFLLDGRTPVHLAIGAAVTGWLAMLAVNGIVNRSRLSFDVALGGTLAVAFGFGLMLLTWIRNNIRGAGTHGLDRYLFGQAATLRESDLIAIAAVGAISLFVILLFWKQFQLLSFDSDYARSLGVKTTFFDVLMTALLVAAVVIGLQAVGVVLMSALIVAPAVAARQWTDRLGRLLILAAVLGAVGGVLGTLASHWLTQASRTVPTGPTIVVIVSIFVLVSLAAAPWCRRRRLA